MIKAVVFDIGGVLCEWKEICRKFAKESGIEAGRFLEVFTKLSLDPVTGSDLGRISLDEFFEKLSSDLGVAEKAKDWRKRFVLGYKRIEPTYKLVEELKGKFKLAILTNAKIGLWDEWKEGKLRENFEVIVDSSEEHVIKPDERIFQILLDRLKLKSEECLFIDDDEKNTQAAEKLGFRTVHFTNVAEGVKLIRKILDETV
ncbi:MAG: HAD family phosphatase [Candidatus Beckwithbacteria bacterium]